MKKDIAALAGVSRPTVDLWLARYVAEGGAELFAAKPSRAGERGRRLAGAGADPHHAAGGDGICRTGRPGLWPTTSPAPPARACRITGWQTYGASTGSNRRSRAPSS
ncbi:helix-turn-helix domain-containing protein [Actinoplanes sp. TRM88002]|uniref:Helix-turn-helix domain-containing protein n=1 Tax=Paractinoplanes hotanensis TaxID=2906497 RepID=A0ABT0XY70_9ACTN|nr:helix-turn-helix domain-containing protein [Actinoplanes hotanensis]MCM4078721.1 helix-turn-helix domain-containing protein [Actinoplanes hotanensis]